MKTAGIIGGFGPETTAQFYLEIVKKCYEKNKIQRPPILIWNVPLKYEIEEKFLKSNKGAEKYLPFLIDAAKRLEHGKADFIVMPCNSLHIFINEIRRAVKIPILNIVEETVNHLHSEQIKTVGVLGTQATLKHDLYQNGCSQEKISCLIPNNKEQKKMGRVINNIVRMKHSPRDEIELHKIIDNLITKGGQAILLACTDLHIMVKKHKKAKIYDTMKILANSVANQIFRKKKT